MSEKGIHCTRHIVRTALQPYGRWNELAPLGRTYSSQKYDTCDVATGLLPPLLLESRFGDKITWN